MPEQKRDIFDDVTVDLSSFGLTNGNDLHARSTGNKVEMHMRRMRVCGVTSGVGEHRCKNDERIQNPECSDRQG